MSKLKDELRLQGDVSLPVRSCHSAETICGRPLYAKDADQGRGKVSVAREVAYRPQGNEAEKYHVVHTCMLTSS